MKNLESRAQTMGVLQDAVLEFNLNLVRETAQRALTEGLDALDAIVNGLAIGMDRVGELYAHGEYFLPEVTMCADAFYEGLAILRPYVKQYGKRQGKVTVVIGTVEGDEHDIGKNLVKLILEVAGCTVYDLGVDVRPEEFVQESIRQHADLVCLSATMTTTSSNLRQVIDMLRLNNPKIRIMVGGSAVTKDQARRWGVDGYAPDAWSLWRTALRFANPPSVLIELAPVIEANYD